MDLCLAQWNVDHGFVFGNKVADILNPILEGLDEIRRKVIYKSYSKLNYLVNKTKINLFEVLNQKLLSKN